MADRIDVARDIYVALKLLPPPKRHIGSLCGIEVFEDPEMLPGTWKVVQPIPRR